MRADRPAFIDHRFARARNAAAGDGNPRGGLDRGAGVVDRRRATIEN